MNNIQIVVLSYSAVGHPGLYLFLLARITFTGRGF